MPRAASFLGEFIFLRFVLSFRTSGGGRCESRIGSVAKIVTQRDGLDVAMDHEPWWAVGFFVWTFLVCLCHGINNFLREWLSGNLGAEWSFVAFNQRGYRLQMC